MLALFSRILKLSGKYKCRIQGAFVCAFLESILSKMPIFLAFLVLSGFYQKTLTGTKCLYIGIGLVGVVAAQVIVHYLCDRLQSAAGYMIFTDKRMESAVISASCRWVILLRATLARSVRYLVRIWYSLKKLP